MTLTVGGTAIMGRAAVGPGQQQCQQEGLDQRQRYLFPWNKIPKIVMHASCLNEKINRVQQHNRQQQYQEQ